MSDARDSTAVRISLALLRTIRIVVPGASREEWVREWEAEIRHRSASLDRDSAWPQQADLVRRSAGALADAAWLRQQFTWDLDLMQDVRHALRLLRKRPAVTALAVFVLALGIGGTVAVFSIVDLLLVRTLPYRDADRIVTLWEENTDRPDREGVSPATFLDWRERVTSFSALAAAEPYSFDYLAGPEPVTLGAGLVVGLAGAVATTRVLAALLFHVSPTDPLTLIATTMMLALVAMVACYLPARRVMRLDPLTALRSE